MKQIELIMQLIVFAGGDTSSANSNGGRRTACFNEQLTYLLDMQVDRAIRVT